LQENVFIALDKRKVTHFQIYNTANKLSVLLLLEDLISKYAFNSLNELNLYCLHNCTMNEWKNNSIVQSFPLEISVKLIGIKFVHIYLLGYTKIKFISLKKREFIRI
jgi:hypothetical protein